MERIRRKIKKGENIIPRIRKYMEYREEIRQNTVRATILFADLKDSTAYKLLKSPEEALAKIYCHNFIVTRVIENLQGDVVKYLGDGVMSMFQGDKCEINAIEAAITIQKEFESYNEKHRYKDPDKIHSKIGINAGDVFLWKFKGHVQHDPQGTVVDIASRITDLAKPDQILCLVPCKEKCSGRPDIKFGDPVSRKIKGIKGKIDICEIIWSAELGIDETVYFSPKNDRIETLLSDAITAEEKEKYEPAIIKCEQILEKDPQHFIANYKIGRIIYLHWKELERFKLENALEYIERAKESNPKSALAKLLHAVISWEINQKSLSDEMLEYLINETEIATKIFKEELNTTTELTATNSLAYFYGERYKRREEKADLKKAINLCEFIEREYNRINAYQQVGFFDTYGTLLTETKERKNLKKAYKLLKDATKVRDDPYVHEHLSQLLRLADELRIPYEELKDD